MPKLKGKKHAINFLLILMVAFFVIFISPINSASNSSGNDTFNQSVTQEIIDIRNISPEALIIILTIFVAVIIAVVILAYVFLVKGKKKDSENIGWNNHK